MRLKTVIAGILIVLGIVALAYQGITYTSMGRVIDLGPMHVTSEETHHIPLPPILGVIALVGGIVLLVVDRRRLDPAA
jgi:membrane-bound ClpP family serine protease